MVNLETAAGIAGLSPSVLKDALRRGKVIGEKRGKYWFVDSESASTYKPRGKGFNAYRVEGDTAYVQLTDRWGQPSHETLVNVTDMPKLLAFGRRWCAMRPDYPYAEMRIEGKGMRLHRFILDAPDGVYVDHINGNTLDNRRVNLRVVTPAQNCQNRKPHINSKSGIKNVCWDKTSQRWRVYLCVRGRRMNIGYVESKDDAVVGAENARLIHHSHAPDHSRSATEIGDEVGAQLSEML